MPGIPFSRLKAPATVGSRARNPFFFFLFNKFAWSLPFIAWDEALFKFINSHHSAVFDVIFWSCSTFGSGWGIIPAYLFFIVLKAPKARLRLIIADSPSIPRSELEEARTLAREKGWPLDVIQTREFDNPEFIKNNRNRCYVCKGELFARMRRYADDNAIPVLAYGETADDLADATRVGKIAARENGVVAPLLEAGLRKDDIRTLSRQRGLPTWNKASFACLSSRFPVGRALALDEMAQVERAEEVLKKYGFRQYRARHHEDLCRIEIDLADFDKIVSPDVRSALVQELKNAGYRFVTLDLSGYKTGGAT